MLLNLVNKTLTALPSWHKIKFQGGKGRNHMANLFIEVGTKIQEFLDNKSMTQTELADKIGVSKQVMGKIIHGKKAINLLEISRIAEAMGLSIDSLVRNSDKKEDRMEPVFLMMGCAQNPNTSDDFRFLNHVMDEMIALDRLLGK
jgi:transcriptional regulator with XRE-family HTH domain